VEILKQIFSFFLFSFNTAPSGDSMKKKGRIEREAATVEVMIRSFCHSRHGEDNKQLCPDCEALLTYAKKRLQNCPFQEGKTTCGQCSIHCYRPDMREKIRLIMQTIGPGMLLKHPIMGMCHALDGMRKKPITDNPAKKD